MAKKVFAGVIAAFAIRKIAGWAGQLMSLAGQQEKAEVKLEAVIKATGGAAGKSAEELKKTASALQDVTTYGDEAILSGQSILLTFKEIKGTTFDRATKAMLDMSTVMDGDLKGAALQVGKALNDPIKGINALARAGVSFTQAQKDQIKAMVEAGDMAGAQAMILKELESEFGGAAEAIGGTGIGAWEKFKNVMGDVGESVGGLLLDQLNKILPALQSAAKGVKAWIESLRNGDTWISKVWNGLKSMASYLIDKWTPAFEELAEVSVRVWNVVWDAMKPVVNFIKDILILEIKTLVSIWIGEFTALEVAVKKWKDVVDVVFSGVALVVVKTFEVVKYWMTQAAPGYLEWFSKQWRNVFTDVANFTSTVFSNMWDNIADFWENVKRYFNGEDVDFKWKGLTEGFKSAIDELPQIAERKQSDLEKSLSEAFHAAADRVDFAGEFKQNKQAVEDFFKAFGEGYNDTQKKAAVKASDYATGDKGKGDSGDGSKDQKKDKDQKDGFKATIEGLEALNSRITATAAGNSDQKKLQDEVKKQGEKQTEKLDGIKAVNEMSKQELTKMSEQLSKTMQSMEGLLIVQ